MLTYWEAKGETFKELDKLLDDRDVAIKKLIDWAEKQGGNLGYSDSSMGGFSAALRIPCEKFDNGITNYPSPKDGTNWKQASRHGLTEYWVPKATKEGKKIAAELRALEVEVPSKTELIKLVGMEYFGKADGKGLSINSIQVYRIRKSKKRILVVMTQENYDPKKLKRKNKPNLVRISDLEFEKATKGSILKKDAIL